jgi:hypothetical protein
MACLKGIVTMMIIRASRLSTSDLSILGNNLVADRTPLELVVRTAFALAHPIQKLLVAA